MSKDFKVSTIIRNDEELANAVFPNLKDNYRDIDWLCG